MFEQLHNYLSDGAGITPKQFDSIKRNFEPGILKKNEFLLRAGETCNYMYFVITGCIRFYTTNPEGDEMTRYFAFENKFGTALTSFINQQPSEEFMQTALSTEVLKIKRQDFYTLVNTIPEISSIYRNMLEQAYIMSQQQIYGFQGYSALERLKWLMAHHPKILTKLSSKVIASYLGVTQYTLSRLKSEL
ncbi:Crp/Fnr family transcriptional regulator [Algoriphagus namhaensis]|uniref:Crp/Fnr family transcriptional regulator n=1 Tax=Algoriphagus namhaensis TaxID=915353 RepID=A0ABV8AU27_9BACT